MPLPVLGCGSTIYLFTYAPSVVGMWVHNVGVVPGDELERLVEEQDRQGELEDRHPLGHGQRGDVEHHVQEVGVEDQEVEREREGHGEEEPDVDPWGHHDEGLVLGQRVERVGHLDGDEDRQCHGHRLGRLEDLAGDALEVVRLGVAAHVVGQLVVGHLGSSGVVHEPVGGAADSRHADVDADSHVPEEQPWGDEGFVRGTGRFVHDVKIGRVEGECGGRQTVSDQVDPEKLNGNESLWQAEGSSEEDADELTDVATDEVPDELLHVVVDGTSLLDGGHDAGEVVVGEDHLAGRLGDGGAGAHGDADLGLLEGGRVVDAVPGHGGDLLHALQVLDDLGLVEWLHAGEHAGVGNGNLLLVGREVVKFASRVGHSVGGLVLVEDPNAAADGGGRVLVVAGDHDDPDAGGAAQLDGRRHLGPGRVQHADNAGKGQVHLVFGEFRALVEVHVAGVNGCVGGGEGQAPEGVSSRAVLDGLLHDLGTDLGGHWQLFGADPVVGAAIQHALGSALNEHLGSGSETGGLLGGAVGRHGLAVAGEL